MAYAQHQSHKDMAFNAYHHNNTNNNANGIEIHNVTRFSGNYDISNLHCSSGQGQVPFNSYPHISHSTHLSSVVIPTSNVNTNPLPHNDGMSHSYYNQGISSETQGSQQKRSNDDVTQNPKPKRQKKSKDAPKRPKSAYNFFFELERKKILDEISGESTQNNISMTIETKGQKSIIMNATDVDEKKKPSKKLPHRKCGFENLGKLVGARWSQITPEQLKYYEALSQKDSERYAKEKREYELKCKNKTKQGKKNSQSGNSFSTDETGKKNSQISCLSNSASSYEQEQSNAVTNSMSNAASSHYDKSNIGVDLNAKNSSTAQENSEQMKGK